jgi:hypothetical protein
MFIDKWLLGTISVLWAGISLAMPPVEILQSCKDMEVANKTILMEELDRAGLREKEETEANCEFQYDTEINGKLYGWVECDNKPYIIIAGKKIPLESAKNYSINPAVNPNIPIISRPFWWRIAKGEKSWLCLVSPISDTGSASNAYQYYIVEDAFEEGRDTYTMYYYFFDKNVFKWF